MMSGQEVQSRVRIRKNYRRLFVELLGWPGTRSRNYLSGFWQEFDLRLRQDRAL